MAVEPYYDPDVRAAIEAGPTLGTIAPHNLDKVRAQRIAQNAAVPLSDEVERWDVTVAGPEDNPAVRLRLHRPKGAEGDLPCIFWVHGGGYVLGAPEQDDQRFDRWCQRFGCMGAAVQYRLGPETPYPGGLEDAYAALRWVKQHGAEVGIDAGRVGIGG
ncbi:MAG: alpha/beta hydrolase, partial [Acidimicrobiia bacterium]|nr:alpha/beta hydrolase [Acidimicrobiia bacterium]